MDKKLTLILSFISISILPLNFDKELNDLKKTAAAIGSDSWDRASFKDNFYTKMTAFEKCTEQKPHDPKHVQKCKEQFIKEVDQQLHQDGINFLKLFVTGIMVTATGKAIEYAAQSVTSDPKANSIAKAFIILPDTALGIVSLPLWINIVASVFNKLNA